MYYRLTANIAEMSQYWEAQNNQHVLTILGEPLSIEDDAVEIPFLFTVTFTPGLDGEPKRQPLYDFVPNVNAMHKRLAETLQAAGVDNLQTFPVLVQDDGTGRTSDDYVVVNVIGLVSAANLAESSAQELADVHVFDRLVVDEGKARAYRLFRLAESQIDIVVDERIAESVRAGQFAGVVLEPVG